MFQLGIRIQIGRKTMVFNASLRWITPHPSRRYAAIHLLPQGEKEDLTHLRHRRSIAPIAPAVYVKAHERHDFTPERLD
ncbi:hypothetical protein MesoLj113a_51950 [Mesorhizobium sp. 113-1-2]|nr:hypothetical protein MesoLj113a_51950 [Mesorhizobium sp. 113-1-2]